MALEIENLIKHEIAAKIVSALPEEQKNEIIARGIARTLYDLDVRWEVKDLLKEEAMRFAVEYAKRPEVQEKLRAKAHEAVDEIIDGIAEVIGKGMERYLKSEYVSIFKE